VRSFSTRVALSLATIATIIAVGELLTHSSRWTTIDLAMVSDINAWHFTALDSLALGINTAFSPAYATAISIVVAIIIFSITRNVRSTLRFLTMIALTWAGTQAIKVLIHRPRPDHAHLSHRLISEYTLSFPSGHTTFAVSIGLALVVTASPGSARRIMAVITSVLGVTVAYSRVYLGVHYVTDVVAGIVYAAAAAVLIATLWDRYLGSRRRNQVGKPLTE
jgi:membrane-associated phospholipid phosphatase